MPQYYERKTGVGGELTFTPVEQQQLPLGKVEQLTTANDTVGINTISLRYDVQQLGKRVEVIGKAQDGLIEKVAEIEKDSQVHEQDIKDLAQANRSQRLPERVNQLEEKVEALVATVASIEKELGGR